MCSINLNAAELFKLHFTKETVKVWLNISLDVMKNVSVLDV